MTMRKLVIANWKMHYGPVKAGAWIRAFRRERLPKDLDIGVAVPHVSLAAARASLGRAGVPLLGAQDVFWANEGAYTGEISPAMLKEFGLTFSLVGHSERRIHLGETDEMVNKKAIALQCLKCCLAYFLQGIGHGGSGGDRRLSSWLLL